MPNRSAYDASSIDWSRIRAYAKRVARETRRAREQPLSYTVREFRDITKKVETSYGPFRLFTKLVDRAERVAVDRRVEVAPAHWMLEVRHHHIERNTKIRDGAHQETTHEQHYVILLPNGTLQKAVMSEEEVLRTEHGKATYFSTHDHRVSELNAYDVQAMDFEKRYSEHGTHGKGTKTWGDREPGTRLISHAKGVGLTQALKRLL